MVELVVMVEMNVMIMVMMMAMVVMRAIMVITTVRIVKVKVMGMMICDDWFLMLVISVVGMGVVW